MRKQFIFIFSLFIVKLSFAQSLTARLIMPDHVDPGTSCNIEVTIIKGAINSFMKFTQELPISYTASAVDLKGGTLSVADSMIKIIWVFPPSSNEFTFSYKITFPDDASGMQKMGGKIFYLFNTKREVFELEPKIYTIGNNSAVKSIAKPAVLSVNTTPATVLPVKIAEPVITTNNNLNKQIVKSGELLSTPINTKVEKVSANKTTIQSSASSASVKTELKVPVSKPIPSVPNNNSKPIPKAERSYRVQVASFMGNPNVEGIPQLSKVLLDNGMTKYLSGNFATQEEALIRKTEMIAKGFRGAFIVVFENGKIVK